MGEVIVPDKIFPEWRVNSEFITLHLNRAFGLDSKLSSHPIEVECPDANHINQVSTLPFRYPSLLEPTIDLRRTLILQNRLRPTYALLLRWLGQIPHRRLHLP